MSIFLFFGLVALMSLAVEGWSTKHLNSTDRYHTSLFLSPYIEKKEFRKAREASKVGPIDGVDQVSYAGFITVNTTTNSNMFFWFWPAQKDPDNAPLMLWLDGGPGTSSLFGMFVQNGPYKVTKDTKVSKQDVTWNSRYSMLYIDNPVGTGFSFTDKDEGYATNEVDVGRDLHSCMMQFFQVFEDFRSRPFYIAGASYAGKYIPALGYKIHTENKRVTTRSKINLTGLIIGAGFCDPETMMPTYADYLYNVGMLDLLQRDQFQSLALKSVQFIQQGKFTEAYQIWDMLLLAFYPYKPFIYNATHSLNMHNYMRTKEPEEFDYYLPLIKEQKVKDAIHVGHRPFNSYLKVFTHLIPDIMDTVKPWVAVLMDNYKVLMYNGQLDIIVAHPLTEAFLMTVPWSGLDQYKKADRLVWKVKETDQEVAGYVRQVNNFYQVLVRGAGHITPYDQPERTFDMIDRFIHNRPFSK